MHTVGPLHVAHGPRLQYWVEKRVGMPSDPTPFTVWSYGRTRRGHGLHPFTHFGDFPTYEAAKAEAELRAQTEQVLALLKGDTV